MIDVEVISNSDDVIVVTDTTITGAWISYVPTFRWQVPGGTPATFTNIVGRYTQIGKAIHFYVDVTMANIGIGNDGVFVFMLPPLPISSSLVLFGTGHEIVVNGKMLSISAVSSNTNEAYTSIYDGTSVITIGNGARFVLGGTYETA